MIGSACGGGGTDNTQSSGESPTDELRKVRHLLNFTPNASLSFLYLAKERGYYEDEGLDIEFVPGQGTTVAIDGVASGEFEFANAGTAPAVLGIAEGRDILSVGTMLGRFSWAIFVDEDSDIQSFKDLEGKEVIATAPSIETPLWPALWKLTGVDGSKVKIVNVDPDAKVSVYANGEGDAMATGAAFGAPLVNPKRPSRFLSYDEDAGMTVGEYSFLTSRELLESEPELVESYLRATYRGMKDAIEDPEAAVQALIDANPGQDLPFDLNLEQWQEWSSVYGCSDAQDGMLFGRHAESDWEFTLNILSESAGLEGSTDPERFYTNQFFDGDDPVSDFTCPVG